LLAVPVARLLAVPVARLAAGFLLGVATVNS
jgi:hypothetical protein